VEEPRPPGERAVAVQEEREIPRRWEAPVTVGVWEAGPFSLPPEAPRPVWETRAFDGSTFEIDGRTHVVFGPWEVVVRDLGAFEERRVLSRWMVYRSWSVDTGDETRLEALRERMLGSSARVGGSERRFPGASELLRQGASELSYRGASERLLRGASERRFPAASEKLSRGGSDRRLRGASGRR
jgi:hypothetical protein